MAAIFEACIALTEQINNAKTLLEHQMLQSKLDGFYRGLEAAGRGDVCIGSLIMDCDRYYMDKGIDRPMCGGVFLDWKEPARG